MSPKGGKCRNFLWCFAIIVVFVLGYTTYIVTSRNSNEIVTQNDFNKDPIPSNSLNLPQPSPSKSNLVPSESSIVLKSSPNFKALIEAPPFSDLSQSKPKLERAANTIQETSIPWKEYFKANTGETFQRRFKKGYKPEPLQPAANLIVCPKDIEKKLAAPRLTDVDIEWCKWAVSPSGGAVVVGKSWGKVNSKEEQAKFDALNCNFVATGKNPSCDDSWGDIHLSNWRNSPLPQLNCKTGKMSNVQCFKNENNDKICTLENVMIDFSKTRKRERSGGHFHTPSKHWENNFISLDCSDDGKVSPLLPFSHLIAPQVSREQCDYVHNGTVLMFSHDDIRNLGHTLNDIFNVWIMLWMDGSARFSHEIDMLNIDSFKLGHNFMDEPNAFFLPYHKNLHSILKGNDFGQKTVCLKRVLVQPVPPRFFIWESWFTDMTCSFLGPSALYQRWNMHVRHSYGLLKSHKENPLTKRVQVLLVVRKETKNLWGSSRTSRNFLNTDEIVTALNKSMVALHGELGLEIKVIALDLGTLKLEQQIKLISESSIMVGAHGAGMASSMHMAVGSPNCCGILEVYPKGEFSPIKGHGNMARKMGLYYDRLDVGSHESQSDGVKVPAGALAQQTAEMIRKMARKPTCVLQKVIDDPYAEDI